MRKVSDLFNSFGDSSTVFSFFPSESHKKAVLRITVGLESRCGLVMLTGEIGTGKTTLFRYIQRQKSDRFIYAEIGNPFLSPMEQVSHFCKSFGLESPQSLRHGIAILTNFFSEKHKEGRQVVLIFDETHLLTKSHWGQILVFSNLREDDEPIVQVLLVGQTELVDRLMEPGLEALNQRIGIRCELSPLSLDDTRKYVRFKLESSGGSDVEFTNRALTEVWKLSGGVPRLINHACSHLLDQIVFSGGTRVTPDMVKQLASDAMYTNLFDSKPKRKRKFVFPVLPCFIVLFFLLGIFYAYSNWDNIRPFLQRSEIRSEISGNEVRGKVVALPEGLKSAGNITPEPAVKKATGDSVEEGQDSLPIKSNSTAEEKPSSGSISEIAENMVDTTSIGSSAGAEVAEGISHDSRPVDVKTGEGPVDSSAISDGQDGETAKDSFPAAEAESEEFSYVSAQRSSGSSVNESPIEGVSPDEGELDIVDDLPRYQDSFSNNTDLVISLKGKSVSTNFEQEVSSEAEDNDRAGSIEEEVEGIVLDGNSVPQIASIVIEAVAYSDLPGSRIAVLNQKVMRQGDYLGKVRLLHIGKDGLIFVLENNKYRRVFGGQTENNK